jgi:hypothetical protein
MHASKSKVKPARQPSRPFHNFLQNPARPPIVVRMGKQTRFSRIPCLGAIGDFMFRQARALLRTLALAEREPGGERRKFFVLRPGRTQRLAERRELGGEPRRRHLQGLRSSAQQFSIL